jgi:hypothetical protein
MVGPKMNQEETIASMLMTTRKAVNFFFMNKFTRQNKIKNPAL